MPFDPNSAKPVSRGFDPSTASAAAPLLRSSMSPQKQGNLGDTLMSGLRKNAADFMKPIYDADDAVDRDVYGMFDRRFKNLTSGNWQGVKDDLLNIPNDTVKAGLATFGAVGSPVAGAVNMVTRPVTDYGADLMSDQGRVVPNVSLQSQPGKVIPRLNVDTNVSREQNRENLNAAVGTVGSLASAAMGPKAPKPGAMTRTVPVKVPAKAPRPKISPDVVKLREKGVIVTPGQAKGGFWKAAEDKATSIPILGDKIQEARTGTLESFNKAVVNDSLAHLRDPVKPDSFITLPDDLPAGHDAVAFAKSAFSRAYNDAKPANPLNLVDQAYLGEVNGIPERYLLAPESRNKLQQILRTNIATKLQNGGTLAAQEFQNAITALKQEQGFYSRSQAPEDQRMSAAIDDHIRALEGVAKAQDPTYAKLKDEIDAGYARFARIRDAAGKQGAEGGVFTPSHYDSAIRSADDTVGRGGYATGQALNQDLSTAARRVLPSKVPDSGTAGRGMMGVILGGGAGIAGGPAGLAATGLGLKGASMAYEPAALARFNRNLDARILADQMRQQGVRSTPPLLNDPAAFLPSLAGGGAISDMPVEIPALPPYQLPAAAEEKRQQPPRKRRD